MKIWVNLRKLSFNSSTEELFIVFVSQNWVQANVMCADKEIFGAHVRLCFQRADLSSQNY